jgi:hypothetical protein
MAWILLDQVQLLRAEYRWSRSAYQQPLRDRFLGSPAPGFFGRGMVQVNYSRPGATSKPATTQQKMEYQYRIQ